MLKRRAFTTLLGIALFAGHAAAEQTEAPSGPAMTVRFDYYPKDYPQIRALEHRLESAIKRAAVGELGETEFHLDGNDGFLYMDGPDPDRLYGVVSPILKSSRLMANAEVTKRYGARTETFVIHRTGTR
ncbi:hypothetical protein QU481_21480 [Crenobacter sp. SG2303]|uniref:Uncharacterized protein n=1 Tax=Crenobacter oryzisoli TaxID=3056844 RepID=A0ABT7XUC3_9NEIS|nr:hypothetical protein [Crenobacter sp. SG2303]MDN0077402.1 hypothetical protein [Crenobacter sp. SG2303]